MEGHAGTGTGSGTGADAGRLSGSDVDEALSPEVSVEDSAESETGTDQTSPEVSVEDSAESETGTDQTSPEVSVEDSAESETGTDQAGPPETAVELPSVGAQPGSSRLNGRWLAGTCAALVLLTAGMAAGGYLALRSHGRSEAIARDDAAAVAAAQECLAATQAPDAAALPAAQQKIIECSTGDFGAQATLYSGVLAQTYQLANVHVEMSDMRAAVERHNDDGSIDLLMAIRVKVDNSEAQGQDFGYRLRVTMERDEGEYKISRLDQVAK